MMKRRALLVVLSGPAGSGKSTLAEGLIRASGGEICRSLTATTRPPRPGEVEGQDYFFLTREEFKQGIAEGRFVEYTEFNGHLYGSPRSELERLMGEDKVVLLVIDVDGSGQVRTSYPHAIHIFLLPPTKEILRQRLVLRQTEDPSEIQRRLQIAEREISRLDSYDYLVINDDQERAIGDLLDIIRIARLHHVRGGEREAWEQGLYAHWHATHPPLSSSSFSGK